MNTAQVSIELILAGILALFAFVLPFWRGAPLSTDLFQTDALIGVLGLAYLLGVVFDKLADTLLRPLEDYARLKQADRLLSDSEKQGKSADDESSTAKDPFPQNRLEYHLRAADDGRLEWMNSLKSRIRTSREVAVLGLPACMGIVLYQGITRDCAAGSQACAGQWTYIFVLINLVLIGAAAVREQFTPDEEQAAAEQGKQTSGATKAEDTKAAPAKPTRITTSDLSRKQKERADQLESVRHQTFWDSLLYMLLVLNSVTAIGVVATLKPSILETALSFGLGGLIVGLLSLWTCLRITRTYLKFVARAARELRPKKKKSK